MKSFFFMVLVFAIVAMNEKVVAKEYKVGDGEGWKEPEKDDAFYKQWAAQKTFRVGDSLRFEYQHDSVLVVEKYGYYHCNMTKPIKVFKSNNNTVFNLTKPGSVFFISGYKTHCDKGQRLAVEVVDLHSPPKKSATIESVSVKLVTICLALVATSATLVLERYDFF